MKSNYMAREVELFFDKLDRINKKLEGFSQDIDGKKEKVFEYLKDFENNSKILVENTIPKDKTKLNPIEEMLAFSMNNVQDNIAKWNKCIRDNKKGTQFMKEHEKYLVIMVFGAVKAGKSSLGNFFAGKDFKHAVFENEYKNRESAVFATQEKARKCGGIEQDTFGDNWFSVGVTDTTGSIQYFTLSGLRWMDSPGTGALSKDGDERNMEEMVNEYIPYTDLCIFLMNSSEPGLQADMKYIEKLSRDGQEAIVVITKSDRNDEDEDENGNLISNWIAKSIEDRKLQEDDICQRIKQNYPNISSEKYKAISVSTMLAKIGIDKQDESIYKSSNLDRLMRILGDKVNDDIIKLKESKPKKNLNNFINSIIEGEENFSGINDLKIEFDKIISSINDYKVSINNEERSISSKILLKVKEEIQVKIRALSDDVERTGKSVDGSIISREINNIINPIIKKEINCGIAKIIENYCDQETTLIKETLNLGPIEKKSKIIEHTYYEIEYIERDPEGFFEHVRNFFGKKYYSRRRVEHIINQNVDLGTNVDEYLDEMLKSFDNIIKRYVKQELEKLQQFYFLPQENYVKQMRENLLVLEKSIVELRVL